MALRLRRGTDAERLIMTPPDAGELIYTTDTKAVYVGDGTTPGGIPVSGAALDLDSLGDVDLSGGVNAGEILQYNGTQWVNTVAPDVTGNVYGRDSTLLVDTDNSVIVGPIVTDTPIIGDLVGDVTGNADGNHTGIFTGSVFGTLDGDVTGSVFGDDSTIIVDAINQTITVQSLTTNTIIATDYTAPGTQPVRFVNSDGTFPFDVEMEATENFLNLQLIKQSTSDLTGDTGTYGKIDFRRNDINGAELVSEIWGGGDGYFYFTADENGLPSARGAEVTMTWKNGQLGIGTYAPSAVLDVQGEITSTSFVQFGSLTTVERDDLTPANGMVIYNTTNNKFEGYQNGAWINLDDGTSAS